MDAQTAAGGQQLAELGFGGPKGTYTPPAPVTPRVPPAVAARIASPQQTFAPGPVFSQAELLRAATSGAGTAPAAQAVQQVARPTTTADRAMVNAAARTGSGQLQRRVDQNLPGADRAMMQTASRYTPPSQATRASRTNAADRAMLQTAARTGAQAPMVRDTRGPGGDI